MHSDLQKCWKTLKRADGKQSYLYDASDSSSWYFNLQYNIKCRVASVVLYIENVYVGILLNVADVGVFNSR